MTTSFISAEVPTSIAAAQAKADAMPRYRQPMYGEEKVAEKCDTCGHHVTITLDGKVYDLCVSERDTAHGGEVYECDPQVTDCVDWVPDE